MNRVTLYVKVYQHLLNQIEQGVYGAGDRLPPETDIARELGVSLITVRRAMQELATSGIVVRQAGRGTFVATTNRIDQPVSALTSFTTDMEQLGIVPSSVVLEHEVAKAGEPQASSLRVRAGSELFHVKRVRNGDGVPLLIEDVFIPLAVCPELPDHDFQIRSLYGVLTEAGIQLTQSIQVFEPILLTEEQCRIFRVPSLTTAFSRQATSYQEDLPIEWVESIYRKDRFRFVVETGKYYPKLQPSRGREREIP